MSIFLDDIVDTSKFEMLVELEENQTENFCAIVKALDLCPETDFRNCDLREVDFSHCDLSNFDFSGSDLRNAYGVDVVFPPVEAFTRADIEGSLFSNFAKTEETLREKPDLASDIYKRTREDALEQSMWILEVTSKRSKDKTELAAVSTKLFEQTKFTSVKNSVLYSSMNFLDLASYKEFLFHLFATQMSDVDTIKSTLKLLAKVFPDDREAMNYPLAIIRSEKNYSLFETALQSIYRSRFFRDHLMFVRECILDTDRWEIRQQAIKSGIGSKTSSSWPLLYSEDRPAIFSETQDATFLDFANPISKSSLIWLAKRSVYRDDVNKAFLKAKDKRSFDFQQTHESLSNRALGNSEVGTGLHAMKTAFERLYTTTGIKMVTCSPLSPRL